MIIDDQAFRQKLTTARFLIIDDEPNLIKTIENMLGAICRFKDKDKSIFTAGNARDALKILMQKEKDNEPIDMVFLDLHMPVVSGIDTLRAIRGISSSAINDVPLMIVTAVQDKKLLLETVFEGADGFFFKPFTAKDLLLEINSVLRGHWSKIKSNRKKSKRKDERLDTSKLKLNVDVNFMNGDKRNCQVINMSERGARIYFKGNNKNIDIDIPEGMEFEDDYGVESINLPSVSGNGGSRFTISVVSLPEINLKGFAEVLIPLRLENGFPNDNTKQAWREWISLAKKERLKQLESSRKI